MKKDGYLKLRKLSPAHCIDFIFAFVCSSFLSSFNHFLLKFPSSYEKMHLSDSRKENNEDTVMHEYIHDAFKETFRDSNYDIIWWVNTHCLMTSIVSLSSFCSSFFLQ